VILPYEKELVEGFDEIIEAINEVLEKKDEIEF
jgi:hypothetical protein